MLIECNRAETASRCNVTRRTFPGRPMIARCVMQLCFGIALGASAACAEPGGYSFTEQRNATPEQNAEDIPLARGDARPELRSIAPTFTHDRARGEAPESNADFQIRLPDSSRSVDSNGE